MFPAPSENANSAWPPGASTRASSSKKGIMFACATRSNERVGKGESRRVARSRTARVPQAPRGVLRLASASIASARSTPTTRARESDVRSQTRPDRCRCRGRARWPEQGRPQPAQPRTARGVSGSRIVSQLPRSRRTICATSGRKNLQRLGLRRTAFVERRANFWPRAATVQNASRCIRMSWPSLIPNISAALPPLIAIEMFR